MKKETTAGKAEILFFGEEAKEIFSQDSVFECLGEGFSFSEGPAWMEAEGCLYFTDFPEEKIYRWDPQNGVTLYTDASHRAIGLFIDAKSRIISCESRLHRIAVVNAQESRKVADQYQGKRFNSPNDVIAAGNGDIYFTDPFSAAVGRPSAQGFNGVYRILLSGEVSLVCKEIKRPNGLALSRDESILYVNDTDENVIYAFDRDSGGAYVNKRKFAGLDTAYGPGACDGMKVDRFDHIWVTGPAGIWLLSPEGNCIAIIKCPEFVGNFCFGGHREDELFITASTSLYRLRLAQRVG